MTSLRELVTLNNIGAGASIVGLAMTVWVFFGVRRLSRFYLSRARLPSLLADLQQSSNELSGHLNDLATFAADVPPTLKRIEASAKSILRKIDGPPKAATKSLLKEVKKTAGHRGPDSGQLRRIYAECVGVLQQVKDYHEDQQWER